MGEEADEGRVDMSWLVRELYLLYLCGRWTMLDSIIDVEGEAWLSTLNSYNSLRFGCRSFEEYFRLKGLGLI